MKGLLSTETRDEIEDMVTDGYCTMLEDRDSLYEMIRYGGVPSIESMGDEELMDELENAYCICFDYEDEGEELSDPQALYKKGEAEIEIKKMLMGDNNEKTVQRDVSADSSTKSNHIHCSLDCVADLNGNMVPRDNRVVKTDN